MRFWSASSKVSRRAPSGEGTRGQLGWQQAVPKDVRIAAWGRDYCVLGQSLENQGLGWAEMGLQKDWSIVRASWQERGHLGGLEPAGASGPFPRSPLTGPRGLAWRTWKKAGIEGLR